MATFIDYITAPFAMLHDAIDAFHPDRPAKPALMPEYWMAMVKRHHGLDEAMRSFHESLRRLESTLDRLERAVADYLAACERKQNSNGTKWLRASATIRRNRTTREVSGAGIESSHAATAVWWATSWKRMRRLKR